jgi:uncharacterized protein YbaR (Trm112 family)
MFIELTDHLRCPAEHEERFLVLLPDVIERRSVRSGQLGCPVCGRTFAVRDGVAELGEPDIAPSAADPLPAEAAHALLGLDGPGGYVLLCGSAAREWRALAELLPGVALVALNPPAGVVEEPPVLSPVRAPIVPLKQRTMRGVVLGAEYAASPRWRAEAARVTLPGLRVVGQGAEPAAEGLELLASAGGAWVAARR